MEALLGSGRYTNEIWDGAESSDEGRSGARIRPPMAPACQRRRQGDEGRHSQGTTQDQGGAGHLLAQVAQALGLFWPGAAVNLGAGPEGALEPVGKVRGEVR